MTQEHANLLRVQRALMALQAGLHPFVEPRMSTSFGIGWRSQLRGSGSGSAGVDAYALLKALIDHWGAVFSGAFEQQSRHAVRSYVTLALDGRNAAAHAVGEMSDAAALRYIDAMLELLRAVDAPPGPVASLRQLYDEQRHPSAASHPSPRQAPSATKRPLRDGSIAERLLAYVCEHPGLDDDELSMRLGIRPRQSINMAARRLEAEGKLVREVGHRGKIVNRPREGL